MEQLSLDLAFRPALGRADFLVAPANELAVRWIDRWPDWPGPLLALVGPAGSGKTHLTQVWRAAAAAVEVDPEDLGRREPRALLGGAKAAVLDDLETALTAAPEREAALFHLLGLLGERAGYLLITGREAPARWRLRLADLRSRLSAAQVAALGPPDDGLIAAVMVKLFADRQLSVGEEVIRYLLPRMERSFAAASALVEAIDRTSLARRRPITISVVRSVLATGDEDEAGAGALDSREGAASTGA